MKIFEFIQREGETMFVPGGWWHGVLNLGNTIAVTQNFCSYQNFPAVWRETRKGRKKMAVKWMHELKQKHPKLANIAEKMNEDDDFTIYNNRFVERKCIEDEKRKEEKRMRKKERKRK